MAVARAAKTNAKGDHMILSECNHKPLEDQVPRKASASCRAGHVTIRAPTPDNLIRTLLTGVPVLLVTPEPRVHTGSHSQGGWLVGRRVPEFTWY